MNKLNAKECADSIIEDCRLKGADLPFRPCLGIIMVEGNEASERYVRNKIKDAERCGFNTRLARLPNTSSQDTVIDAIEEMVDCGEVHGLIVQLPLPKGINEEEVLEHIPAVMDVDGLTKENMAELYSGSGKGFAPCTPEGCIRLLDYYDLPIEGKTALVVGRSNLVGKPLSLMLQQRNATVTTYHSKTPEIMRATDMPFYDMFFFCVGKAKEYNRIDIFPLPICDNEEKVVIDVGINFDENGKLCGDFDPASCEETDRVHYSPVPGGIGLMTRAILMEHVLRAAYMMGEFKGLWTELKDSQS